MGAIAENDDPALAFCDGIEIEMNDGVKAMVHPIVVDGKEVATVTKHDGFWIATISGDLFCGANGNGETPAEAMAYALTSGVARMADALAAVRALAVEFGGELVALAEGLA